MALVTTHIDALRDEDKRAGVVYANLYRELAHAYCGLGRHEEAFTLIDQLLARYADTAHPLLLGNLHATAASDQQECQIVM